MTRPIASLVVVLLAASQLPEQGSAFTAVANQGRSKMVINAFGTVSKRFRKRFEPSSTAPSSPQTALSAKSAGSANTGGGTVDTTDSLPTQRPSNKIDTSNFDASSFNDATLRADIRNDIYQKSLHRLLCDGEEECIF